MREETTSERRELVYNLAIVGYDSKCALLVPVRERRG